MFGNYFWKMQNAILWITLLLQTTEIVGPLVFDQTQKSASADFKSENLGNNQIKRSPTQTFMKQISNKESVKLKVFAESTDFERTFGEEIGETSKFVNDMNLRFSILEAGSMFSKPGYPTEVFICAINPYQALGEGGNNISNFKTSIALALGYEDKLTHKQKLFTVYSVYWKSILKAGMEVYYKLLRFNSVLTQEILDAVLKWSFEEDVLPKDKDTEAIKHVLADAMKNKQLPGKYLTTFQIKRAMLHASGLMVFVIYVYDEKIDHHFGAAYKLHQSHTRNKPSYIVPPMLTQLFPIQEEKQLVVLAKEKSKDFSLPMIKWQNTFAEWGAKEHSSKSVMKSTKVLLSLMENACIEFNIIETESHMGTPKYSYSSNISLPGKYNGTFAHGCDGNDKREAIKLAENSLRQYLLWQEARKCNIQPDIKLVTKAIMIELKKYEVKLDKLQITETPVFLTFANLPPEAMPISVKEQDEWRIYLYTVNYSEGKKDQNTKCVSLQILDGKPFVLRVLHSFEFMFGLRMDRVLTMLDACYNGKTHTVVWALELSTDMERKVSNEEAETLIKDKKRQKVKAELFGILETTEFSVVFLLRLMGNKPSDGFYCMTYAFPKSNAKEAKCKSSLQNIPLTTIQQAKDAVEDYTITQVQQKFHLQSN